MKTELEMVRAQLADCTTAMRAASNTIDACLVYGFCADDLRAAKDTLDAARGRKYLMPDKTDLGHLAERSSAAPAAMPDKIKNKADYFLFLKAWCERMQAISRAKNQDYTGDSVGAFANFERVEALGVCKTEVGFLTRMTDKLARLSSFVQRGDLAVKSESVEDTLIDLANYCALMAGYLRSK